MSPESFCGIFVSTYEYLTGRLSILEEKDERNAIREERKGGKERKESGRGKCEESEVERRKWREGIGREGREGKEGERRR
jgi:hypothetical protein